MFNRIKNIDSAFGIFGSFILFLCLGIFFQGGEYNDHFYVLTSTAAFLFGVFIAFSISTGHATLNKLHEVLKSDEAQLLSMYQLSEIFGEKTKQEIQKLIDNYLMDQVDYYLEDFKYSMKSFMELFNFFIKFNPEGKKQDFAYQKILDLLSITTENRKQVEMLAREKVSKFEWLSILSLLSVVLFFIYYFNNGSFLSVILSAILSTAAVALVLVLKDLDNLRWKEGVSIWAPLHDLFETLDLLPYYPGEIIKNGRVKLEKGQKVRLAEYPDPYPDMTNKIVRIIEV